MIDPGLAAAYRGRRVLVTGAGGFIGRRVALMLANAGADVHLGVRDASKPGGPAHATATAHRWSAKDRESIESLVDAARPEIVFNLAGYGVDPGERDPDLADEINARLPHRLARAIARTGGSWDGPRLVHAGSALEYGAAGGDLGEDTDPLPTTLYGRSKLAGTLALEDAGLESTTARLFTVYGPGERPGRLLPSLIERLTGGARCPVTAGEQRRDFTYVDDVAEGMLRIGLAHGAPRVLNLATGVLHSVRGFIETAVEVIGADPELIGWGEIPTREEEMSHDPVSIDRLVAVTAWRPRITPAEGIRRTVALG